MQVSSPYEYPQSVDRHKGGVPTIDGSYNTHELLKLLVPYRNTVGLKGITGLWLNNRHKKTSDC